MPSREENRQFKLFQKEFNQHLKESVKGTPWRKKNNSIFRDIGGQFYCACFYPCADKSIRLRIETKPMGIDPLFCDIFKLPENKNKSLSFRAWGAFSCPSLIFFEENIKSVEPDIPPSLDMLFNIVDEQIELMKLNCDKTDFSQIIQTDDLHTRTGSYGVSLIMCLICENKLLEARKLAYDYEIDKKRCNHTFLHYKGKSFNSLAIEWIDERL